MSELLPCPFCGGVANDAHLAGSAWFIDADHADDCHFADFQHTEAEAVAAWNLRAPPASPTGRQLGPGKRDELPPIVSEWVEPSALAGREAVARVIDPEAWDFLPRWDREESWRNMVIEDKRAPSLAKADAIISLLGQACSALSKATGEGG